MNVRTDAEGEEVDGPDDDDDDSEERRRLHGE
jgi:hypothetical protein